MGGLRRAAADPHHDWINYIVACRTNFAESLREHMPDLYAYLGGECGWSPSELDKHPISDLVSWSSARSKANERSSS